MVSQKTRRRTKIGPTLHPRVVFAGLTLRALTREYSMWLVNKIVYIILNSRGNKYLEMDYGGPIIRSPTAMAQRWHNFVPMLHYLSQR